MTRAYRIILATGLIAATAVIAPQLSAAPALQGGKGGGDAKLQTTRAAPAPEGKTFLNVEVLAEGLVNPWSIAFLPDGKLLFTERDGRLRLIDGGTLLADPVAGAPETLVWYQGGFFDVLLHPNFSTNNVIYLSYAHGDRRNNALRIARAEFYNNALNNLEVIYEATPLKNTGHHFGGRLAWGADGMLYATIGEGAKYREKAQDTASSFGAVIRLNEDGSAPLDNPDFGNGALPELFTKGHRNPQGLTFDAERGVLWETEHGPRGGDELNIIEAGANYGWPFATYGVDYNGARITPFTEYTGTNQPAKYWTPSISPSGLAVYRGDLFPDWDGDLFVAALSGKALHRVIMEGNKPVGEERYLIGERIRDVRVGLDGAIYVSTEERYGDPVGKILRLTPK